MPPSLSTMGEDVTVLVLQFCLGTANAWSTVRQVNKRFLRISDAPISQTSIKVRVNSVQELNVYKRLKNLSQLKSTAGLVSENLLGLSQLNRLESLSLKACRVTTLDALTSLTNLKNLEITSPDLTAEGVVAISTITSLQHVDLRRCRGVTTDGLAALACLPNLRSLVLDRCSQLTDGCVANLVKASSLESVNFNRCELLTDRTCLSLAILSQLRNLDLRHCHQLTDAGIAELVKINSLESLHVNFCTRLTEASYDMLVQPELGLKFLDIRGCPALIEKHANSDVSNNTVIEIKWMR